MATVMEREILSQPEALRSAYEANYAKAKTLAEEIKRLKINQIIVAARGSSNNASLYFKYLCEISVGIPVNFVYPSIITQYKGKLRLNNACLFAVSQSGRALDALTVMQEAREQGAMTVAVTNDPDSPLAKQAQHHMYLAVGKEEALAATRTFTAQMLTLMMVVRALEGALTEKMPPVDELIGQTLEKRAQIEAVANKYVASDELIILARGLNLSVANEIALKLQETCYINARGYAISDFHHGPFALVNKKTRILMIAVNDHVFNDAVEMLDKVRPTGADVTLLTDDERLAGKYDSVLLPKAEESLMPFSCVAAGQLMSCLLSVMRGINPDKPRGLNKVTVTK